MKYKKGDIIYIKPLSWYNANKNENGEIIYKGGIFSLGMRIYCGRRTEIKNVYNGVYTTDLSHNIPIYDWMIDMYSTDRMRDAKIKGLTIQLDQNAVDKVNLAMDSNDKFISKDDSIDRIEPIKPKKVISDNVITPDTYVKNKVSTKDMKKTELKKLEVGTKVIGTDKTGHPLYFGFYEGRAGRGYYKVRVSETIVINCATITPYKHEVVEHIINKKFESANVIARRNSELKTKISELIKEHNNTYGTNLEVVINIH